MNKSMCLLVLLLAGPMEKMGAQLHGDVIINEVLFNPAKDGYDYVELYNRSGHAIDLSDLLLANRNATDDVASVKNISRDRIEVGINSFVVITTNEKWVRLNYIVPDTARIIEVSSMPSFPDDEGHVLILRKADSAIIDELEYSEKWHFQLLKDVAGISLERIDSEYATQNKNNWTSASSSAGFGSPGYQNSQSKMIMAVDKQVSILPKIFSPDNNGIDDFTTIQISVKESGNVANAALYDVSGRRVRYLVKNAILGNNNRFTWDGFDDNHVRLPSGIYILFTQIFDMMGNNTKFRNCVVLDNRSR